MSPIHSTTSVTPSYEALDPQGLSLLAASSAAAPLSTMQGKTIGLFWNGFTNGNVLLEALAAICERRFPGVRFVKLPAGKGLEWGHYPERSLTDVVREYGIAAALVGPGC